MMEALGETVDGVKKLKPSTFELLRISTAVSAGTLAVLSTTERSVSVFLKVKLASIAPINVIPSTISMLSE